MDSAVAAAPRPAAARAVAAAAETTEFRAFYTEQYRKIAGYAFLLVRDEELARDLTQEAFTRLLTRWVRVREPRPYLFHVVTNLARDHWRWSVRERETVAALSADLAVPGADHGVHDAVARLPERLRTVVSLYYFADLPLHQVAAAVRRPEGTVKRQLSEARALLAKALEDPHA